MTISTEVRRAGPYAGNGAINTFPFAFKVFTGADVEVTRTDPDGVEDVLGYNAAYYVTLNSDQDASPGGVVHTYGPIDSGWTLTITSRVAMLQPMDLLNQGGFYPKVIEDAFDRQTILTQQLAEKVNKVADLPDLIDAAWAAADAANAAAARTIKRIVVMGDSLSAVSPLLHDPWPRLLERQLKSQGISCEVINVSVAGSSFELAASQVAFDGKTMLQRAIELQADIYLVALGFNDTVTGGASSSVAVSRASFVFGALAAGVPNALRVYVSERYFDTTQFPANLLNEHVPPLFHQLPTTGPEAGCRYAGSMASPCQQVYRTRYAQWSPMDTAIRGLSSVHASIHIDMWKAARLGGVSVDGLHPNQFGAKMYSAYVNYGMMQSATIRSRLPGVFQGSPWVPWRPDDLFAATLRAVGNVYESVDDPPNLSSELINWDASDARQFRPDTWMYVSNGIFFCSHDDSVRPVPTLVGQPFTYGVKGAQREQSMFLSLNDSAWIDSGRKTDYKGDCTEYTTNAWMPAEQITFKVKVGTEVFGPISVTFQGSEGGGGGGGGDFSTAAPHTWTAPQTMSGAAGGWRWADTSLAPTDYDPSRHVQLHPGAGGFAYGISVSSNRLNLMVPAGATIKMAVNGVDITETNGSGFVVAGGLYANGAAQFNGNVRINTGGLTIRRPGTTVDHNIVAGVTDPGDGSVEYLSVDVPANGYVLHRVGGVAITQTNASGFVVAGGFYANGAAQFNGAVRFNSGGIDIRSGAVVYGFQPLADRLNINVPAAKMLKVRVNSVDIAEVSASGLTVAGGLYTTGAANINGASSLNGGAAIGSNGPVIHTRLISATLPAAGGSVDVSTGLDSTKVISVDGVAWLDATGVNVVPRGWYNQDGQTGWNAALVGSTLKLTVRGNGSYVQNRPCRVFITYTD